MKKVLIVGAGITGSTLAALLEQNGIIPTIVDKAAASDPNGYGITIMPRGMTVLNGLGIRKAIEGAGTILRGCELYDEHEKKLNSFGLSTEGIKSVTLSRDDLLAIIRGKLKKTEIKWRTSIHRLKNLDNGVRVTFSNGTQDTYDLVVGADGINSQVRSLIMPGIVPRKVGAAIWMFNLPANLKIKDKYRGHLTWGMCRFMALFPYKNTAAIALTMPLDPRLDPKKVDITTSFADMSRLSNIILSKASSENMYCGHLRQLKLKKWHKGLIVLAGDAAHAMVPATGMGASNGIQDAGILAKLITEMPVELFDKLPNQYQKVQKPIIDSKQDRAYMFGRFMLLNNYQATIRNEVSARIPKSVLGRAMVRQLR